MFSLIEDIHCHHSFIRAVAYAPKVAGDPRGPYCPALTQNYHSAFYKKKS